MKFLHLINNDKSIYYVYTFTEEGVIFMITRIQKWGNSNGIRLPKQILKELKWENEDMVNLQRIDNKIVIEKEVYNDINIEELFDGFEGDYEKIKMEWGDPVGEELW